MNHLEVAVAAPLSTTLTYLLKENQSVPEEGGGAELAGYRVLVPLGRRTVTGFILGPAEIGEVSYTIRPITTIVDGRPLFPAAMVALFRWAAQYYQYPIGEVITAALPAGLKASSQKVISLTESGSAASNPAGLFDRAEPIDYPWLEELRSKKKLSPALSKKTLADKKSAGMVRQLVDEGLARIEYEVGVPATKDKRETCYSAAIDFEAPHITGQLTRAKLNALQEEIRTTCAAGVKFSELQTLYHYGRLARQCGAPVPQKDISRCYSGAGKALRELCDRGFLHKTRRRVYRNPLGELPGYHPAPHSLTDEQTVAVDRIRAAVDGEQFSPFLLYGVTGSGKTEVYLRGARQCLDKGRDVLVLVPEIALATQLEAHFVSRFGEETIALLHSGLSRGEKYDQWSLAAGGRAKIVIGARSAVFAPLQNVGIIIVDEEHDGGFKQHDGFKYNGRDLAVLRAKLAGCTVVLGSATPSITSYHHGQNGKYELLRMQSRVGRSGLPKVEVIDLGGAGRKKGQSPFHEKFITELERNLENGEQSLVLINRRGFSNAYICQECGTSVQCRQCNVALTYHKKKAQLLCHYCGYTVSCKLICSNCHSETLVPFGVGTERLEEELRERFPEANIQRLDSDTAADRKKFLALLKAMGDREIDILIGTQMIAKGHHFPSVTFVGVVWADGGLNMPDFRSAERTYQLLSQVTGRAGRGESKGRVIIQTMRPEHYAIALARTHDYEKFYQKEIELRRRPAFPPYVRLANYRISGEIEFDVRRTAENICSACRRFGSGAQVAVEVFGPAPSPLEKIKNRYRWQILLKSSQIAALHDLDRYIKENSKSLVSGTTRYHFDMDPENMM
ncbi:MAG: primosomal protein N' [Desulfopila sp.]